MEHLTIRNIPSELAEALQAEKRRRGVSLNQIAIDLLRQSLGIRRAAPRSNGLGRLAGSWNQEELAEFESAIRFTEEVDEEVWK